MQYKMFAGDQGWEGLIRHWHMLHGACLYELRRHREKDEGKRRKHGGSPIDSFLSLTKHQKLLAEQSKSSDVLHKTTARTVFPQRHTNSVSKIK